MVDVSNLEQIEVYRDPNSGALIGRDPSDNSTFPLPVDSLDANSINAGSISTDALEAKSTTHNPNTGSKYDVDPLYADTDTATSSSFDIDTGTLSKPYDNYKVLFTLRGESSSMNELQLQLNGLNSDYEERLVDGTSIITNENQSSITVGTFDEFWSISGQLLIGGQFGNQNERATVGGGTVGSKPSYKSLMTGVYAGGSISVDELRLFTSNEAVGTVIVEGFNVQ